jgi:hypothetical protein
MIVRGPRNDDEAIHRNLPGVRSGDEAPVPNGESIALGAPMSRPSWVYQMHTGHDRPAGPRSPPQSLPGFRASRGWIQLGFGLTRRGIANQRVG